MKNGGISWNRLGILPFKALVLLAYPALKLYLAALPHPRYVDIGVLVTMVLVYLLCCLLFSIGCILDFLRGRRVQSIENLAFAVIAAVFYALLPPLAS